MGVVTREISNYLVYLSNLTGETLNIGDMFKSDVLKLKPIIERDKLWWADFVEDSLGTITVKDNNRTLEFTVIEVNTFYKLVGNITEGETLLKTVKLDKPLTLDTLKLFLTEAILVLTTS